MPCPGRNLQTDDPVWLLSAEPIFCPHHLFDCCEESCSGHVLTRFCVPLCFHFSRQNRNRLLFTTFCGRHSLASWERGDLDKVCLAGNWGLPAANPAFLRMGLIPPIREGGVLGGEERGIKSTTGSFHFVPGVVLGEEQESRHRVCRD